MHKVATYSLYHYTRLEPTFSFRDTGEMYTGMKRLARNVLNEKYYIKVS